MTFERTHDYRLVREIMTQPEIYPHITDDFSPPAEEYRPVEHDAIWYVLVFDSLELLGLWMLTPQNGVCVEVHTCLLPNAWGSRARLAAQQMAEWIWDNTPFRRIVTTVPMTNRLALAFARQAGMIAFGINERSFLKEGMLINQICLGLSKPIVPVAETPAEAVQEV